MAGRTEHRSQPASKPSTLGVIFSFAMPTIYVSTKLATLIGKARLLPRDKVQVSDSVTDWNAQLFSLDRRECIMITNKVTLYSLVRLDILKKDLNELPKFFINSLFDQLKADGLYNDKEENFWLDNFSNIEFSATDNDKKVIGSMNDMIYQLKVAILYKTSGLENPSNIKAGQYVNDIPMGLIQYRNPLDKMRDLKNNA